MTINIKNLLEGGITQGKLEDANSTKTITKSFKTFKEALEAKQKNIQSLNYDENEFPKSHIKKRKYAVGGNSYMVRVYAGVTPVPFNYDPLKDYQKDSPETKGLIKTIGCKNLTDAKETHRELVNAITDEISNNSIRSSVLAWLSDNNYEDVPEMEVSA